MYLLETSDCWKLDPIIRSCCYCIRVGNISVECPKNPGLDAGAGETKNPKKTSQAPKGFLVGPKMAFKPNQEYRPVTKKHTANSSGNKKKGVDSTSTVSDSNPYEVLNSVDNDVEMGTNGGTSNLDKNGANSSGSSFWNVKNSSTSTTLIMNKLGRVSVDNDMARSLASERTGFGTKSLLEQWTDSYGNGDYDEDPYDDDMYEGHDLSEEIQTICDKLDIRVQGRKKAFNMGGMRFKEDEVSKLSTSVFVTIFSDLFTAKELWNVCKKYRNVVDAYNPNRRSKAGKRFGFMRFIKVFDEQRLGSSKSYAHIVSQPVNMEVDNIPALVLDESCLNQQNYSYYLMGKVKEISSLSNLKMVLATEGFDNIELKYMGGYWVMIEFQSEVTKTMFETKVGTCTCFSQLQQASNEFTIDGRVTWVEIEGVPLRMWSENTFTRIASKWGILLHVDDQEEHCKVFWIRAKEVPGWVPELVDDNEEDSDTNDDSKEGNSKEVDVGLKSVSFMGGDSDVEEVSETKYEEEIQNYKLEEVSVGQKNSYSEDPFNIYELLNKKEGVINKDSCMDYSVKYPLGFSPTGATGEHSNKGDESQKDGGKNYEYTHKEEVFGEMKENCSNKSSNEDVAESVCSGHFKKSEVPHSGGSILQLMDDMVKVGQTMGYNMDGCMKNIEEIIESQGMNGVPNGNNLLIILVYAPQELSEKKMLWDYLSFVIANWKGEVVMIGDFNEVRKKDERFGSLFNVQGADVFNLFISNAGLEENNEKKKISKINKISFKAELAELYAIIDKGEGNVEVVNKRMNVVKSLQELEKLQSLEAAQKEKIK
ncbi:nucleotide-binding alpha-beta plait domain-containing protein [Tanacetum coccineum]